jgi:hypothetical protein
MVMQEVPEPLSENASAAARLHEVSDNSDPTTGRPFA